MSHPGLWPAQTGLTAIDVKMQTISNNLANLNTKGFKRDHPIFQSLMYQTIRQPGANTDQNTQSPTGLMLGTGTRVVAVQKQHTMGSFIQTNKALDVAIDGRGFLQVALPDGTNAYSRNGELSLDANGNLVTADGYLLEPNIVIPDQALSITIGRDGIVSVLVAGQSQPSQVGQIQLADFVNESGLQPIGKNLFTETFASGAPTVDNPGNVGLGGLQQGSIEGSNVNAVEEMVDLIQTQRNYESTAKAISAADGMLQFVNQTI